MTPMTETAKLEALKPCPFCGVTPTGIAVCHNDDGVFHDVFCRTRGCRGSDDVRLDPQEMGKAITAWNTRALSVSRPAVKGLEWKANSANSIWTGELAFGAYYTAYDEGDGWRLFRGQFLSSYGDHELAFGQKAVVLAAAQSDFDQRILSSLSPPTGGWTVDDLAQEIRRVDGEHSLGAGALAEALMPFLSRLPSPPEAE